MRKYVFSYKPISEKSHDLAVAKFRSRLEHAGLIPKRFTRRNRSLIDAVMESLLSGKISVKPSRQGNLDVGLLPKELQSFSKSEVLRTLFRMKKADNLRVAGNTGAHRLALTNKGMRRALALTVNKLIIPTPRTWLGNWIVVLFDVPEICRTSRNAFRGHLKALGFVCFQKSAWIYPHPCREQILYLARLYEIEKWVTIITATEIDNEETLRKHFNLK